MVKKRPTAIKPTWEPLPRVTRILHTIQYQHIFCNAPISLFTESIDLLKWKLKICELHSFLINVLHYCKYIIISYTYRRSYFEFLMKSENMLRFITCKLEFEITFLHLVKFDGPYCWQSLHSLYSNIKKSHIFKSRSAFFLAKAIVFVFVEWVFKHFCTSFSRRI